MSKIPHSKEAAASLPNSEAMGQETKAETLAANEGKLDDQVPQKTDESQSSEDQHDLNPPPLARDASDAAATGVFQQTEPTVGAAERTPSAVQIYGLLEILPIGSDIASLLGLNRAASLSALHKGEIPQVTKTGAPLLGGRSLSLLHKTKEAPKKQTPELRREVMRPKTAAAAAVGKKAGITEPKFQRSQPKKMTSIASLERLTSFEKLSAEAKLKAKAFEGLPSLEENASDLERQRLVSGKNADLKATAAKLPPRKGLLGRVSAETLSAKKPSVPFKRLESLRKVGTLQTKTEPPKKTQMFRRSVSVEFHRWPRPSPGDTLVRSQTVTAENQNVPAHPQDALETRETYASSPLIQKVPAPKTRKSTGFLKQAVSGASRQRSSMSIRSSKSHRSSHSLLKSPRQPRSTSFSLGVRPKLISRMRSTSPKFTKAGGYLPKRSSQSLTKPKKSYTLQQSVVKKERGAEKSAKLPGRPEQKTIAAKKELSASQRRSSKSDAVFTETRQKSVTTSPLLSRASALRKMAAKQKSLRPAVEEAKSVKYSEAATTSPLQKPKAVSLSRSLPLSVRKPPAQVVRLKPAAPPIKRTLKKDAPKKTADLGLRSRVKLQKFTGRSVLRTTKKMTGASKKPVALLVSTEDYFDDHKEEKKDAALARDHVVDDISVKTEAKEALKQADRRPSSSSDSTSSLSLSKRRHRKLSFERESSLPISELWPPCTMASPDFPPAPGPKFREVLPHPRVLAAPIPPEAFPWDLMQQYIAENWGAKMQAVTQHHFPVAYPVDAPIYATPAVESGSPFVLRPVTKSCWPSLRETRPVVPKIMYRAEQHHKPCYREFAPSVERRPACVREAPIQAETTADESRLRRAASPHITRHKTKTSKLVCPSGGVLTRICCPPPQQAVLSGRSQRF